MTHVHSLKHLTFLFISIRKGIFQTQPDKQPLTSIAKYCSYVTSY